MDELVNNLMFSIKGLFTDIFPFIFETICYYGYMFLFPILFATTAYFIVLLIRRIRGD